MYDINQALTTGVIKRIYMSLKELINFIIMKLKDFIYNKKTKESNLLGVLFVVVVTIVCGAVIYYGFWI